MGLLLRLHAFKLNRITYLIHASTYNVTEYVRAIQVWTTPQTFKRQRQDMLLAFDLCTKKRLCDDVMKVIHEHLLPICVKCNKDIIVKCNKDIIPSCIACW